MKSAPSNQSSVLNQNLAVRQREVDKLAVLRLKHLLNFLVFFLSCGASAHLRVVSSTFEVSTSNLGTPHSVELLCTSDQPDAETYT